MAVRRIDDDARLAAARGDSVVCIRPDGPSERLGATVRSVQAHTPGEVPIVVAGSGDEVFELTAPADVVLVAAGTLVSAGWLDGLRDAAYGESLVATASALATRDVPEGWTLDRAAEAVRSHSLRLRPRLARVAVRCAYVRRSAIELAGGESDVGFSKRCVDVGLAHVLADDVLVSSAASDGPELVADDYAGAFERSLHRARRALTDMSVLVDARILSRPITGTQVHVLELIAALARADGVRVSAIVPDRLDDEADRGLGSLPDVALVGYADAHRQPRADVVHRPFQVDNPGELNYLARLGERLLITHQDLIGYNNSSYFESARAWEGYRELTRTALAVADRVLFFSAHARDEALAEELVESERASVVPLGIDHAITGADAASLAPTALAGLAPEAELMLCLGSDYRHKNRVFALRMLDELRRRHGWAGVLVLAGPRVSHGSSAPDERRLLSERPALAGAVVELGPVSEPEKHWLLERARLVLYPTIHEGFGLVPFEAAAHGAPCMWAAGTSLSELLDDSLASLVAWDPAPSADRALELMRDDDTRARNVDAIRSAGQRLTWNRTAAALLEVYERTCDEPAAPAGEIYRERGLMNGEVSDDAARLIGPGGALPADVQRPLLALATHPRIGTPLFGALKLGYRASHGLRLLRRRFRA